jgi:hypothetical protein
MVVSANPIQILTFYRCRPVTNLRRIRAGLVQAPQTRHSGVGADGGPPVDNRMMELVEHRGFRPEGRSPAVIIAIERLAQDLVRLALQGVEVLGLNRFAAPLRSRPTASRDAR